MRRGEWLIRRKEILEENKTKDPRLFLQWRFETPYVVRKCPVLRKKKKTKKTQPRVIFIGISNLTSPDCLDDRLSTTFFGPHYSPKKKFICIHKKKP